MNSAKPPVRKARKGEIGVYANNKSWALNFPRQWFSGKQLKKTLPGLAATEENYGKAADIADELERDFKKGRLDDGSGNFNEVRFHEVLREYGLVGSLRIVQGGVTATASGQLPPKPEMSILEVWDMYCEYKRHSLAETTYQLMYKRLYINYLNDSINAVGNDALCIRNWLVENRSLKHVKSLLSLLSNAYSIAIRQKLINHNPFEGSAEGIENKKRIKIISQNDDNSENDANTLDIDKAYSWEEAITICDYIQNTPSICHLHAFTKFKFLTGCRTGEAIALWWKDVKWDKECIVFERTYSQGLKIFKPTKNETTRIFPMPKDGELWNLFKSLSEGKSNEIVFKTKQGKIINKDRFQRCWKGEDGYKGIIPPLIEQGKISKYLPPYNTRHTFITHQIYDLGRDPGIVNAWCEHSESVSTKHYRDISRIASGINPDLPANMQQQAQTQQTASDLESLKETIKTLQEQLKLQQELITSLQQQLQSK